MKRLIPLILLIIIAVAGFVGYSMYQENQRQAHLQSVDYALDALLAGVDARDVEAVKQRADIRRIAESIVGQMITEKESTESTSFLEKASGALQGTLASYIKPELANSVSAQLVTFIQDGEPALERDVTSLYARQPLVRQLWEDLGGAALRVAEVSLEPASAENTTRRARISLVRDDVEAEGVLFLVFEQSGLTWKVVALEGLQSLMTTVKNAEQASLEKLNAQIKSDMARALTVTNIAKAPVASKFHMGKALQIRAAFSNIGERDITALKATITFTHRDGRHLKTVTVKDSDVLLKGDTSEKSWQLVLNPLSASESLLFDAPNTDVRTRYDIVSITFVDGETLSLQETLP